VFILVYHLFPAYSWRFATVRIKRFFIFLVALLASLGIFRIGNVFSALTGEKAEAEYTVYSRGMRVGELQTFTTRILDGERKNLKFSGNTHINVNLLVYSYHLDSEEEALLEGKETVGYRRTTRENGRTCKFEGRLDKGRFVITIDQDGARRTMNVNRQEYDHTTMDCPELGLKHEGDEAVFRVLDLETLGVVARKYRWLRSEEVTVNGKRIICRVIHFQDPNKNCRRWITQGEVGALITRQDGIGKSGAYSLRMTRLN
jgi:hypothetical protein